MRKIILAISVIFLALFLVGCSEGVPKIELSTYSFDFGDINPDNGKITETFFVENTGNAPLSVDSVSTSCGCTEAEVESTDLAPGEKTKLIVTYDPSVHPGLVGKIQRIVYIKSNDPLNEEIELELTGNSLPSKSKKKSGHEDNLKDFEVSPYDAHSKIKNKEVKLLDVREQFEYDENHIKDTLLLPLDKITQEALDKLSLKKDDEIIIYCRSGKRSAKAYEILKELGYTNIKSMNGGIIHWMEEEFPVEKGKIVDILEDQ